MFPSSSSSITNRWDSTRWCSVIVASYVFLKTRGTFLRFPSPHRGGMTMVLLMMRWPFRSLVSIIAFVVWPACSSMLIRRVLASTFPIFLASFILLYVFQSVLLEKCQGSFCLLFELLLPSEPGNHHPHDSGICRRSSASGGIRTPSRFQPHHQTVIQVHFHD